MRLTKQLLADLMVTALEGGSNYWIDDVIPTYRNVEEYSEPKNYHENMAPRVFKCCQGKFELTYPNLQNAFALLPQWHQENLKNDNWDADTADVFLQCTLFQDIVYG